MNLLVLLIGGNPIANYALIKYFEFYGDEKIPQYNKVMLIYSKQTENIAKAIKTIEPELSLIDVNIENNERNLLMIESKITEALNQIPNIQSIHLNYTGGTKSMSLGAYLAVSKFQEGIQKIYSDISPVKYTMTLEDGSTYPKEGDLSSKLQISIQSFALLHGLSRPKFKTDRSEFYNEPFVFFLLEQADKNEEKFYKECWDKKFKKLKKLDWKSTLPDDINKDISEDKLKDLQDFIRGKWLEAYLFEMLKEIQKDAKLTDIAWNVESKTIKEEAFEIDVVAISGYKSYVFSCTTDKKAYIKQKAFEGDKRAEQFSGRNANTILVSLANEKTIEKVKKDMSHNEKIFHILGIEDLRDKENFKSKLKEVFR